jgi:hypothetical protein
VAAHGAAGAVAGRAEGAFHAAGQAGEDIGAGAHAAADQHRLAGRAQFRRQLGMARAEGARGALAMHEQAAPAPVDLCVSSLQVLCETS